MQFDPGFGPKLRVVLDRQRMTQRKLADAIGVDPTQVNRWINSKQMPTLDHIRDMETALGGISLVADSALFEMYVAAPITGLAEGLLIPHRDAVREVVLAAQSAGISVYWPGESIGSFDDLQAADLATKRNLDVLVSCQALLYLQFEDVSGPSGALVELGLALGRRMRTTVIRRRGVNSPFLLQEGFQGVASDSPYLPSARIYDVATVRDAARRFEVNKRELVGLD